MTVKELAVLISRVSDLMVFHVDDSYSVETDHIAVRASGNGDPEWFAKSKFPDRLMPIDMGDVKRLQSLLDMPSEADYETLRRLYEE